ncbi:MAG: NADPH-dependent F420 reductase [Pseudonocardia sp. SCN 72-86]|nr:MAG: NADPH-dependent F420 reductase [Pseudonocardia sp. SCN 72-86]
MSSAVAVVGGSGQLGFGVALRLVNAGFPVVIGSRDAERAKQAAGRVESIVSGADVRGETNEEATRAAGRLVILAVPFANQLTVLRDVSSSLSAGQVVLDTSVPLAPALGGRPTQLIGVWSGSAGQQARAAVPAHVGVVSGLHTLSATVLADLSTSIDQDTFICGDNGRDKAIVTQILGKIAGLRVVDAGKLEMSRMAEGLTPLLIGINIRNKIHAGIRVHGLVGG